MAKGRKQTPTNLKLLARNPGKRDLAPPPQTDAPGSVGGPPDWLTESQKKVWEIGLESAPLGVLKKIDTAVFLIWVVACDRFAQANKELQTQGLTDVGAMGGPIQNPLVSIVNKQSEIMIKAAAEMGFTPASRSRVGSGSDGGEKTNPFHANSNKTA